MILYTLFSTKEDTIETNNERIRSKVHSGIRELLYEKLLHLEKYG